MTEAKFMRDRRLTQLARLADRLTSEQLLAVDEWVLELAERALRRTPDGKAFMAVGLASARDADGRWRRRMPRIPRSRVERLIGGGSLRYANRARTCVVKIT